MLYVLCILALGLFLGSFGAVWTHYLVHKFDLLDSSIIWKNHKHHHAGTDTEQADRRKYTMPMYALVRTLTYFEVSRWTWLDLGLFWLSLAFPIFGFSFLLGIFITENWGFLQHSYKGDAVNFTNKFWNKYGCNQGFHSEHHKEDEVKHEVDTEIITGLLAAYAWFGVCLLLFPLLILIPKSWAKVPGAYIFGFWTNLANYKVHEGLSLIPLLRRMPSIFDNPKILFHYLTIIFRMESDVTGQIKKYQGIKDKLKGSHAISSIRNVYQDYPEMIKNKNILVYKDEILEGHHRHFSLQDSQLASGLVYINIT